MRCPAVRDKLLKLSRSDSLIFHFDFFIFNFFMKVADFFEEEKLLKRGAKNICGVDEVGRGPLAGPVAAAAVVFDFFHPGFKELKREVEFRDSKLFSAGQREKLFELLISSEALAWEVSFVAEEQIDRLNILQASILAMRLAVDGLKKRPDFILIDGRNTLHNYPAGQKAIVRGDEKVASIAAASIIAKVLRDRKMGEYHQLYPQYGFDKHKGYGTKQHLEAIEKYGFCPIHRRSFAPFKKHGN